MKVKNKAQRRQSKKRVWVTNKIKKVGIHKKCSEVGKLS